jgi:hypothetical protein
MKKENFILRFFNKISEFFSEGSKASIMRLMSMVMLVVAIWFLFFSYDVLFHSEMDMNWPLVVLLALQNLINFSFAFFPKLIQKKFEQVDVNKILDKND